MGITVDPWRRPYRPGRGRWLIAAWELGALVLLARTTADRFGLERFERQLLVGSVVVWLVGCWRLARLGTYVSRRGVRIRGLFTRRTIVWADIALVHIQESQLTVGRVRVPTGRVVRFERVGRRPVTSTLWADGVDFKFRPGAFQAAYADLRRRHAEATIVAAERVA